MDRAPSFITEATDTGMILKIPTRFGKYQYVRTIGTGATSVVLLVRDVKSGIQYAVKAVSRQILTEDGMGVYFERELRLLETIKHPSIVCHFETVYLEDLIMLVTEYCPNGDLFHYITTNGYVCSTICRSVLYQILKGLEYLHKRGCAHRDLKPENIFLDARHCIKIGDFGLSHQTKDLMSTVCGTLFYTPPEVLLNRPYDQKADIWAVGIIAYTMIMNSLPWTAGSDIEIMKDILESRVELPPTAPENIRAFISACTEKDPSKRPTATELLNMDWMKGEKPVWEQTLQQGIVPVHIPKVSPTRSLPKRLVVRPFDVAKSQKFGNMFPTVQTTQSAARIIRFRATHSASPLVQSH